MKLRFRINHIFTALAIIIISIEAIIALFFPQLLNTLNNYLFKFIELLLAVLLAYRLSEKLIIEKAQEKNRSIARSSVRKLFAVEDNLLSTIDIISKKTHDPAQHDDLEEISNYLLFIATELRTFKGDFKDIIGGELEKEYEGRAKIYDLYDKIKALENSLKDLEIKGTKADAEKRGMKDEIDKLRAELIKQRSSLPLTDVSDYYGLKLSGSLISTVESLSKQWGAAVKSVSGITLKESDADKEEKK